MIHKYLRTHTPSFGLTVLLLTLWAAFGFMKQNTAWMTVWCSQITTPVKLWLAGLFEWTKWSAAEWAVYLAAVLFLFFTVHFVLGFFCKPFRLCLIIERFHTAVNFVLLIWVLMCLLWGANYYAAGFIERSGISVRESGLEELYRATVFFADQLNSAAAQTERNADGLFVCDADEVLRNASSLYEPLETAWPFLQAEERTVKQVRFSYLLSLMETTGFTFPYTGETNVNIHAPLCFLPSTAAHEVAHQRGVASEQEANFLAVYSCTQSTQPEFAYSGWLLGFIHLSNALYRESPDLYYTVVSGLSKEVLIDLAANSAYWDQFEESVIAEQSGELYDAFLKGYGEELGTKSYGAVADLLLAWYRCELESTNAGLN